MQDITQYSDNELSLLVFNTESLYNMRHQANFTEILGDMFIFTPEQMKVFEADLSTEEE